jgi:hypothetical protein
MAGKRYYSAEDFETGVTPSQLKRMGRDRQREYVLGWWARNFEDPANETPYNGREGGYQYIWGGPYEARDELWSEFGDIISEERIAEYVDEIESDGTVEWAPGPEHPDHERAAEEAAEDYHAPPPEPDFDEFVRRLEAGTEPSYGSTLERQERQELIDRIAALEEKLAELTPDYGGIGHNRPPPDSEEAAEGNAEPTAIAAQLPAVVNESTSIIKGEVAKESPNAIAVARAGGRLQALWRWLGGKADAAADEFAKAFGKALGDWSGKAVVIAAAAGTLGGVWSALHGVIHAAAQWLQTVTWGF